MNTVNNFVDKIFGESKTLLGMCPSINVIHDTMYQAERDIMDGVLEYNRSYNHYVVNGTYKPEGVKEYYKAVFDSLEFDEDVKQAYWRACWYWNGGEFYFQYPTRMRVAAMMFRR